MMKTKTFTLEMDAKSAYRYSRYVLMAPFPEAEEMIAHDPLWAYYYGRYVLEDSDYDTWRYKYLRTKKNEVGTEPAK